MTSFRTIASNPSRPAVHPTLPEPRTARPIILADSRLFGGWGVRF